MVVGAGTAWWIVHVLGWTILVAFLVALLAMLVHGGGIWRS